MPFYRPPSDGSVLLWEAVDQHSKKHPDSNAYVFSREDRNEIESIKWLEFARACDRSARLFRPPGTGRDGEVIGIIAKADMVVHNVLTVGLMKAGLKPFSIQPCGPATDILHLLKTADCHKLIVTRECLDDLIQEIRLEISKGTEAFELEILDFPSVADVYPRLAQETADDPFTPYPLSTPRPNVTDTAAFLHTSGSTGSPKAIPLSHGCIMSWSNSSVVNAQGEGHFLPAFSVPTFRATGFMYQLLLPILSGFPVSAFPPTRSPTSPAVELTADNILKYLRRYPTKTVFTMPAYLQRWSQDKDAIEYLKSLDHVICAGSPLVPTIGQAVVDAGVKLSTRFGATETGPVSHFRTRKAKSADWEYIEFDDAVEMHWTDNGDGTWVARLMSTDRYQLAAVNTPDKMGYDLPDLFAKHPTIDGLWRYLGRQEDAFTDAKGNRIIPGPMEAIVAGCPLVKHVMMFGQNRMQPGILIEPAEPAASASSAAVDNTILADKIWLWIEKANAIAKLNARIHRNMLLFTAPDKPILVVAFKSLVKRKETNRLYAAEIDALYTRLEPGHSTRATLNIAY